MDKIKFKLVDGEPVCDICGEGDPCIPGLRQQRDEARADLAEARAVIEKLEVRVDEPCDDCATIEGDELRAVIERMREWIDDPAPATGKDGE
jgi:hypothetical protein